VIWLWVLARYRRHYTLISLPVLRAGTLAFGLVGPLLPALRAQCPGGPSEQLMTVQLVIGQRVDRLKSITDSVMRVLEYERATPPSGQAFYIAAPRTTWPLGADRAPWHGDVAPPGTLVAVKFDKRGDSTRVNVQVRVICAVSTREESRRYMSTEHMLALFSGMQVILALDGELETALHPYDRQ